MKIILIRGIGEPIDSPMLRNVTRRILGANVVNLRWSASYGPVPTPLGEDFDTAVAAGKLLLIEELDEGPAVVLCYSGGCAVGGGVAARGHKNLLGIGFISDPFMPPQRGVAGHGIAGSRPITGVPVMWKHDPKDGICRCPNNNPLRTLADQSRGLSLGAPGAWTWGLWTKLTAKAFQPYHADPNTFANDYRIAAQLLWGYLKGGDHTSYARRKEANGRTYTDNLAEWVKQFEKP